jgi:para-aminobenzoate synthetase component 1
MLYEEFDYIDPIDIANCFKGKVACLLGDGFFELGELNRYSFIGVDPWAQIVSKKDKVWLNGLLQAITAHDLLAKLHEQYKTTNVKILPPFQGGVIGVWYYDFAATLHNMPIKENSESINGFWGLYDLVIAFDHCLQKCWLISTGNPATGKQRSARACERMLWLKSQLTHINTAEAKDVQWSMREVIDKAEYVSKVEEIKKSILAGDLFEVNYTQQFEGELESFSGWDLFCKLYVKNPAPFSAYLSFATEEIISCSPERLLQVADKFAATFPIKGTSGLGKNTVECYENAKKLRFSNKQIAENTMIVDLVRNDLSKVCKPGTVKVRDFCKLMRFTNVQHLVSVVCGVLEEKCNELDAFSALFPAGSITGAPKLQAMKCIVDVELSNRGAYCGSVGYWSFNGEFDSNVLIRTIVKTDAKIVTNAGGAVLLDSIAIDEYMESMLKAEKLLGELSCKA